jgi:hypothetical protein
MKYAPRSFDSIDAIPIADWLRVCGNSSSRDFMLPEFIRAVEAGSRSFARFRHLLIYGNDGEPVACASFSLLALDIADVASPAIARFIHALPRPLSGLFRPLIVMCGLPVSLGQSSIAFTAQCDVQAALLLVEDLASRLSQEVSAQLILFKEFDARAAQVMAPLQTRGYSRLETPAMNVFDFAFKSFDTYCGALKSPYRVEVRHSLRRLARAGARVRVITDASEILATYTPELHRLYLDVVARSSIKLEVLPIDFFVELVRQFPNNVQLILIEKERVLATAWTLHVGRVLLLPVPRAGLQLRSQPGSLLQCHLCRAGSRTEKTAGSN